MAVQPAVRNRNVNFIIAAAIAGWVLFLAIIAVVLLPFL